jgi:SAM-dependent methyltransferase
MTATTNLDQRYAQVARELRDEIIEHYREREEDIDTPAGRLTLDTNTILAAQRGALLLRMLSRRGGPEDLSGLRVVDLGCGFGSLALYLAVAGADVVGIDPNIARASVAGRVAERLALPARFQRGWMEDLPLDDASFDIAVMNNSLCYVVDRVDRRSALRQASRVLRPGGWVLLRNPAWMAPTDPFTGLPFVHQLPPAVSRRLLRRRSRPRSPVRLLTGGGASRELRRSGLAGVRLELVDQPWWKPPRYQHHTARKPPF